MQSHQGFELLKTVTLSIDDIQNNIKKTNDLLDFLLTALRNGDKPIHIFQVLKSKGFKNALENLHDPKVTLKYLYLVVSLYEKGIDVKQADALLRSDRRRKLAYNIIRDGIIIHTNYAHYPLLDVVLGQCASPEKMYPLLCEKGLFHPMQMKTYPSVEQDYAYLGISRAGDFCSKEKMLKYILTFPTDKKREALTNALTEGHPLHDFFNVQRGILVPSKDRGTFAIIQAELNEINKNYSAVILAPVVRTNIYPMPQTTINPIATPINYTYPFQHMSFHPPVQVMNNAAVVSVPYVVPVPAMQPCYLPKPPDLPLIKPLTQEQALFFSKGIVPSPYGARVPETQLSPAPVAPSIMPSAPTLTQKPSLIEEAPRHPLLPPAPVLRPVYIKTNNNTTKKNAALSKQQSSNYQSQKHVQEKNRGKETGQKRRLELAQ